MPRARRRKIQVPTDTRPQFELGVGGGRERRGMREERTGREGAERGWREREEGREPGKGREESANGQRH